MFDEPTTGLHGSDISKLLKLFDELTDEGNIVVVVEHNLDIISQADWIIDMGLGAGRNGGKIIFEGYPKDLIEDNISLTGRYLKKYIEGISHKEIEGILNCYIQIFILQLF